MSVFWAGQTQVPRDVAMLVAPEGSNMISRVFNSLEFYDVGGVLYLVSMLFNVRFLTRRVIVRAILILREFFMEVKLVVLLFCSLKLLLGKEDEFCFGSVLMKTYANSWSKFCYCDSGKVLYGLTCLGN